MSAPTPKRRVVVTEDTCFGQPRIDGSRIDGVVIDINRFSGNNEFLLPTGGGAFHIRANRVIDRGDRWIRIGFEVLGKN